MHRDAQIVGIFGDLEVKRRIIHQNHGCRAPLVDGPACRAQEAEDFSQVLDHVGKAHIGHVTIMDNRLHTCLCGHQVAAQETEFRLDIFPLK